MLLTDILRKVKKKCYLCKQENNNVSCRVVEIGITKTGLKHHRGCF